MLRWGHFLMFLCVYPLLRVLLITVSPLRRGTFSKRRKSPKRLAPTFGPRRLGFLRCGTDPGAAAPVCFAAPPSAVFDFVERSLRSHARINPSTQPSDVAGGSRSRALELALIVEWCGFAAGSCAALLLLLWERACSRRRPDSRPVVEVVPNPTVGAAEGCDLLIWLLLLIFCPFGRLRYGIAPGVAAQLPYDAVVHLENVSRWSDTAHRCTRSNGYAPVPSLNAH